MNEFLQPLKQRKLVQWAVAYVAAAFALLQGLDIVAQRFAWPDWIERALILAACIGFFVVLVLAWYHGERGAQKVSGAELLILALLLSLGGLFFWRFAVTAQKPAASFRIARAAAPPAVPSSDKSIAVLPFVNMSGDAKNDYFSDGITEEILNALSQIPDLKVAARTSAFAFKGKAEDLRKVGELLDVATVLEGSVQKAGDEVRITAQLIDTRTGYHRWSERYDRKLTNIFAVEDEIAKAITSKLQLASGASQSLVTQKTIDPHAHDAYLRGLALLASRDLRDAVVQFQNAVKLAPDYAQAWAGMAEAEALYSTYRLDSGAAAYPRALAAADRALELDPSCASAYVARGMVRSSMWQWAEAEQAFRKALALAPGDAFAVNQYAQFLLEAGQLEAALKETD
ncbi:MAG: tetratricopeptide repeat protein, partial [Rhodanobacteraceae bacterium]